MNIVARILFTVVISFGLNNADAQSYSRPVNTLSGSPTAQPPAARPQDRFDIIITLKCQDIYNNGRSECLEYDTACHMSCIGLGMPANVICHQNCYGLSQACTASYINEYQTCICDAAKADYLRRNRGTIINGDTLDQLYQQCMERRPLTW